MNTDRCRSTTNQIPLSPKPRLSLNGGAHWGRISHRTCPLKECRWAARTTHTWWETRRRAPRVPRTAPRTPPGRWWSGSACGTCPGGRSWCRAGRRRKGRSLRQSHRCGRNYLSRAEGRRRRGTARRMRVWRRPSMAVPRSASSGTAPRTDRPECQIENQPDPPGIKRIEEQLLSCFIHWNSNNLGDAN